MKQLSFLPKPRLEHGGSIRKGRRKEARPFDPKRPVHLVLRSERARGQWSMATPKNRRLVRAALKRAEKRAQIQIYQSVNVGNHLHLVLKAPTRKALQTFLRLAAGLIAFQITRAKKGNPQKFWSQTAYTRLLTWGREFKNVLSYLNLNLLEGLGVAKRRDGSYEIPEWIQNAGLRVDVGRFA
jgi:REP element-mobilizing transposase RayT